MDCLFCKIAKGKEDADIVYEDEDMVAFKDVEPKAPTHILVAPKKHIPTLKEAEEQHEELLGKLVLTAKNIAEEREADGYKLVMNVGEEGGQLIKHIHIHLLIGKPKQWP
ncbi:MAG: histidine triad nucleotide-binding protein [Candidatus Paceibacterota bacterium]